MRKVSRDEEFRAFYLAEGERLERFATMLVGDPFQGAEHAQEALARVYARWGRMRHESPRAYVRQVVLNLVRSAHRARKLRALKPIPQWAGEADRPRDGLDDRVADSMRVVGALQQLTPVRRAAVLLRFYEDLSPDEIARVLDRPVGTVKSDIHRALRQLGPLLEEVDAEGRTR